MLGREGLRHALDVDAGELDPFAPTIDHQRHPGIAGRVAPTWCRRPGSRPTAPPRARRTTAWPRAARRRDAPCRSGTRSRRGTPGGADRGRRSRRPHQRRQTRRGRRSPRGRAARRPTRHAPAEPGPRPDRRPCPTPPRRRPGRHATGTPRPAAGRTARSAARCASPASAKRGADQQRALHRVRAAFQRTRRVARRRVRRARPATSRYWPSAIVHPHRVIRLETPAPRRSASKPEREQQAVREHRREVAGHHRRRRSEPVGIGRGSALDGFGSEPDRRGGHAPPLGRVASIRSSWINAMVCSSSRAAEARTIRSSSRPPAARIPPEAERRPQPLATGRDQPFGLVEHGDRARFDRLDLDRSSSRNERKALVDPRSRSTQRVGDHGGSLGGHAPSISHRTPPASPHYDGPRAPHRRDSRSSPSPPPAPRSCSSASVAWSAGSGSGLGCSTWPECHPGPALPIRHGAFLIEFSHRALAFLVIVLTLATGLVAWRRPADAPRPSVAGRRSRSRWCWRRRCSAAIVVATELEPLVGHRALRRRPGADRRRHVRGGARCLTSDRSAPPGSTDDARFARLTLAHARPPSARCCSSAPTSGPATRSWSFTDWPLMDGRLVPPLDGDGAPRCSCHRVLALLGVLVRAVDGDPGAHHGEPLPAPWCGSPRSRWRSSWRRSPSGAANVFSRLKPWAVVAHVALSVLIWATLVALATVASLLARRRRPGRHPRHRPRGRRATRRRRAKRRASDTVNGLLPADEAPHHRPAADHHRAGDDPGRRAASPRSG